MIVDRGSAVSSAFARGTFYLRRWPCSRCACRSAHMRTHAGRTTDWPKRRSRAPANRRPPVRTSSPVFSYAMMLLPVCAAAPRATVRAPTRQGPAARARFAAPRRASLLNASDPGSFEVCDVAAAFEDCALLTGAAQQARAAFAATCARSRLKGSHALGCLQNCFAQHGCATPNKEEAVTGAVNDVVVQCELAVRLPCPHPQPISARFRVFLASRTPARRTARTQPSAGTWCRR